jgi:hypothetical protein
MYYDFYKNDSTIPLTYYREEKRSKSKFEDKKQNSCVLYFLGSFSCTYYFELGTSLFD